MEYIYSAMLLHKAGQKVTEDGVKKILHAAGVKVDEARVKAMIAALEGVNIDEAIKNSMAVSAAPVAVQAAPSADHGSRKEEKKPAAEEKKTEEMAAAGLGALFG